MTDQTVQSVVSENRQEWFLMLVAYMKMKTWAMWLYYYPETRYESFEVIWPALFDQMLSQATSTACDKIKSRTTISLN